MKPNGIHRLEESDLTVYRNLMELFAVEFEENDNTYEYISENMYIIFS